MRKIIKNLYNPLLKYYFSKQLQSYTQSHPSQSYLVLDIDNTIADTWTQLGDFKKNRFRYFLNLKPLTGTLDYLKAHFPEHPIVFISNRNILDYRVTKKWLERQQFDMNKNLLILTNIPQDKIPYLQFLTQKSEVHYFDDLSYNHENGEVKFYDDVIEGLKKMNITYYNYSFIQQLNH